jgi:Poly(R)-hydroxyalkanoic acid synthase subunit (PHA_synth_III_E)
MNSFDPAQGAEAVYNFWLSFIPQFMGQLGASSGAKPQAPPTMPWMNALLFPADQIAKATQMTQQSLGTMAQTMAPMMGAAAMPNMLTQWAEALQAQAAPAMQSIAQVWSDFGSRMGLPTNDELNTAFDRTYGALIDALGLGPTRQLHAAWQDLLTAAAAQQEARAGYALVVNSAFTAGYERLVKRLADKATASERVGSVLALLKLWAVCTEDAVHETLQSERGLAATAALTRASLSYHKAVQKVANNLADMLGLATRRDLDEAFREIQALKRELRTVRPRGAAV